MSNQNKPGKIYSYQISSGLIPVFEQDLFQWYNARKITANIERI